MSLKKLTSANQKNFFEKVEEGQLVIAAKNFSMDEIQRLSQKHGVLLSYCMPGTDEYAIHGPYTFQVVKVDKELLISECKMLLSEKNNRGVSIKDPVFDEGNLVKYKSAYLTDKPRTKPCEDAVLVLMVNNGDLVENARKMSSGRLEVIYNLKEEKMENLF